MIQRLFQLLKEECIRQQRFEWRGLVGLFESYDQSLVMLSGLLFSIPNAFVYEHMNDSGGELKVTFADLSPEFQIMATENNALDMELYRYVKDEIFPSQIDSYAGDLDVDVEDFKRENSSFRYNKFKWYFLRLCKMYSERVPQRLAHWMVE